MQNFTSVYDVPDVSALVQSALDCKAAPFADQAIGKDKTLILLFFNPSLRTRLSTERAGLNLGMQVINMNAGQGWKLEFEDGAVMNIDRAEHIREAAAVISQYADIIGVRTFPSLTDQEKDYQDHILKSLIRYASVPVVSLESAIRHPLQSLTDLMTIEELKQKERPKVVLSWAPHPKALPQAVSNSFIEWMQAGEVDLVVTHPKGYNLAPEFIKDTPVTNDQRAAFEGADFIYTKNWSAVAPYGKILSQDADWMITADKMALTNGAHFMHCLPVRRNVIVEDAVIDSPKSAVIQQAGNRMYAAQAVLKAILEDL
ncbi:MAG TPA: N-acetylornithine carbamoyltransferase [Saprospiraceae bacterium]|nr:N-acetylornithine carbamoyltransferase [Saprospiraceae bacterium]